MKSRILIQEPCPVQNWVAFLNVKVKTSPHQGQGGNQKQGASPSPVIRRKLPQDNTWSKGQLEQELTLEQMEVQNPQHGKIIEISGDVLVGETSLGVSKICGGAACGFSDAGTISKDAKERSASMRKLLIAVVLCVIFMSVEVVGGIKANSLAILTDAAHLLSDVASFAISLFSLWASGWEATPRQSYGFFRIEILGALVSMQMIWLLAGILVYEAIVRLIHDTGEVKGFLMFLVAAFGLVVNVIMALLLGHDHGHGGHDHEHGEHGHSHGDHNHDHAHSHDHGITITTHPGGHSKHDDGHQHAQEDLSEHLLNNYSEDECKSESGHKQTKQRNINVQGAYLHVLGDSIQSIGVMIGGGLIWYKPEWKIIDLICTLIFSVIVLGTTIKMLRNILGVLMESTPREIDATKLETGLCEMDEVVAVHELHIWSITVGKVLLACHIKCKPEADADMVLDKVVDYIRREYNISHVTIQIERQAEIENSIRQLLSSILNLASCKFMNRTLVCTAWMLLLWTTMNPFTSRNRRSVFFTSAVSYYLGCFHLQYMPLAQVQRLNALGLSGQHGSAGSDSLYQACCSCKTTFRIKQAEDDEGHGLAGASRRPELTRPS
ncbi:hypothetical protein HHK36_023406 [Tetracentron sinense]|uniref:Uncharacterized protein n=1 Tax=Tetracentron sinense TaxID=13715 RepID=A0A834YNM6_TETSI|nr:hypothetical protein HHK36_023406 [Tetracentron sinense]